MEFWGIALPSIGIEFEVFTDPRVVALGRSLGNQRLAMGILIEAWKLASDYWGKGRQLIPHEVWEISEFPDQLFTTKLAERRDDGVYMRGTSTHANWRVRKSEAGRIGGKVSGEVRKNKTLGEANAKQNEATPKHNEASPPLSSPLLPFPLEENTNTNTFTGKGTFPVGPKGRAGPIKKKSSEPSSAAIVGRAFKASYEKHMKRPYPAWGARENGQVAAWLKSVPEYKALLYCEAYMSWNDPYVVRAGHPLSLLVSQYVRLDAYMHDGAAIERRAREGKENAEQLSQPSVTEILDKYEKEKADAEARVRLPNGTA